MLFMNSGLEDIEIRIFLNSVTKGGFDIICLVFSPMERTRNEEKIIPFSPSWGQKKKNNTRTTHTVQ